MFIFLSDVIDVLDQYVAVNREKLTLIDLSNFMFRVKGSVCISRYCLILHLITIFQDEFM